MRSARPKLNAKDQSKDVDCVTTFQIRTAFFSRFTVRTVGGRSHQEFQIPAGELADFNENIVGYIEVIAEFRSK